MALTEEVIAMGNESIVEVTGPGDLAELAERVRGFFDLPQGTWLSENTWESGGVTVKRAYWDNAPAYEFWVIIYGVGADNVGRELYDSLTASTGWALRLDDDQFQQVAVRPAVSRAG